MSLAADISSDSPKLSLTRSIPVMIESGIIVLMLLLFAEALLGPLLADETNPEGSPILRLIWLPVYAIILVLVSLNIPQMIALTMRMPLVIGLMLLIAASTVWSIDQELTARRTLAVGMTTLFGIYLAARHDWDNMLALFGVTWLILVIGSFVVALGVPSLGVEQDGDHVGAWRGLWFQKNAMGGHMSRAALLFGFLAITQPNLRKLWSLGLVLSVLLVFLSTSKTSLLGILLGGAALMTGALMRRGPVPALGMVWAGVTFSSVLIGVLIIQPELILEAIGRDATLTGRTDIWVVLFDVIEDRPMFGHGYAAFWGETSLPAEYVREVTQWEVPTAHNGWLETWLSIGLVGLVLFGGSFFLTLLRSFVTAVNSWTGFFAIGFMLQFFLFSMSESIILQQNTITWLSYMALAAGLVQQTRKPETKPKSISGRRRDFILPNEGRVA